MRGQPRHPYDSAQAIDTAKDRGGQRSVVAPWSRGHKAKIIAAVAALRAAGKLPEWLSVGEVRRRCDGWFRAQGLLAHEIPSRSAYQRHLPEALHLARSLSASDAS
jgi:hypothetical protein